MNRCRPAGLTVLAVIHLISAGITGLALVSIIAIPSIRAQMPVHPLYAILSPGISFVFLLLSGIGFLRQSWRLGFIGGNVLAIGELLNYLAFNLITDFAQVIIHLPFIAYYLVLLYLLNKTYRSSFGAQVMGSPQSSETLG